MTRSVDLSTETPIRPFRIDVPEEDLVDLRRRIAFACGLLDKVARGCVPT